MNIKLLKKLASQGSTWATERLKQLEQGPVEPISRMPALNQTYNMVDNNKVKQEPSEDYDKIIGFRIPESLLDRLQQEKQIKCRTGSSIIKEALADYFYWCDKINELKLAAAQEKAKQQ